MFNQRCHIIFLWILAHTFVEKKESVPPATSYESQIQSLLETSHYLSGDNFMRETEKRVDWVYRKFEFIWTSGEWRGQHVRSAFDEVPRERRKVLVFGHSSFPLSWWRANLLRKRGFAQIFGTNLVGGKGLAPIPLGLPNDSGESPVHDICGPVRPVIDALEVDRPDHFANTIYANYNSSNHRERSGLRDLLLSRGVQVLSPDYTVDGRASALRETRQSNFVFCPRGVGVDTHRFWETLFLGSIPVTLKHLLLSEFDKKFPILQLDSWDQVLDTKFMELQFNILNAKPRETHWFDVRNWFPAEPGSA